MLKKIRFTLFLLVSIFIIITFSIRIWLGYHFDAVVNKESYNSLLREIQSTPKLPEKVYSAYLKTYECSSYKSSTAYFLQTPL